MNWRTSLTRKAENPNFLWSMVIAILGAGLVLGAIVQWVPYTFNADSDSIYDAIMMGWESDNDGAGVERILSSDLPFDFRLVALAHLASASYDVDDEPDDAASEMDESEMAKLVTTFSVVDPDASVDEAEQQIASQMLLSVAMGKIMPSLAEMASADPPVRYANQAIGAIAVSRQSFASAAQHFETEGQFPDANIARRFALDTYAAADDNESLRRLSQLPEYSPLISPSETLVIAEANRDWIGMAKVIPKLIGRRFQEGFATALALIAGLGWLVLAIQMGQAGATSSVRVWLCLVAVVMGGLSIWATHMIDIWQELDWGIVESNETVEGIKFYVLGVGLREEVAKLLLLLPLLPVIIRRRSPIEAMIVSACVGLGFAIVENMGYFARSGGADSMGRFLTANFFHMSMTGIVGLSIARVFWKHHDISHALLTFLLVVLAHGFYDATIAVPGLQTFSMGGTIIFILLSYQFFHEVRTAYDQRPQTISLTASFLFIVSMLTALTFVYVSWRFGYSSSLSMLSVDVIGLGVMVYMYLREMPNSLIR
ncbi:MAG: PrsW family glutamic-type intramembrane protease [Rubripirellula sp.]